MKHMMDELDTNEDSEVSFDEFVGLLKNVLIAKHKAFCGQASSSGHGHSPRHGTDIRNDDNSHCHN